MRANVAVTGVTLVCAMATAAEDAINIGSRLELLVDEYLIDRIVGAARLELHRPVRRDIVFRTDAPWEGNASCHNSVFQDGPLYRMYYSPNQYTNGGALTLARKAHSWVVCYAESDDGLHWRRPDLGIVEFEGSKNNNIILTAESLADIGGDLSSAATFKDANPDCPADERYKIVIFGRKPHGLYALKSADGLHFSPMTRKAFVTNGDFDSQNLAFWDSVGRQYREYHRGSRGGRDIMTSAAKTWDSFPQPQFLEYPGAPKEQLYTNEIQPYYRAPHIFVGFPMRYQERGWPDAMFELPGKEERLVRGELSPRYGMAITDALFMSSRDGVTFHRWPEAFIRPGPRQRHSWVYGDNCVFWGMVETKSGAEDAPDEISLYATDSYWEGIFTSVRRYTVRVDGFVSAAAHLSGGEVVTKPIVFEGGNLALNFETSGAGSVRVEIQDAAGKPMDGYALADCPEILGDSLRHIVRWKGRGGDVRPLAGKPVRLRFVLRDADLYSFQFVPHQPDPVRPDVSQFGVPKLPKKTAARGPFVVLDDDFQAAKAGTSPSAEDLNPTDKAWLIQEGEIDRVQVLNDDPVGSGKPGARRHLKVERRDENQLGGGLAWIGLVPADATETENGIVEVELRLYVPASNAGAVGLDAHDDRPPWNRRRHAFHVGFLPDGSVCSFRGRSIPGLRVKTDTWQDVFIRAHMKNAVFDITVEGKTAEGVPFANPDLHRLMALCFSPKSPKSTLYMERLKVRVIP